MSTNSWSADEEAMKQLEALRAEHANNAKSAPMLIEALKAEISNEINLIKGSLSQPKNNSFMSRFKGFKRGTDQNISDLEVALEILNKKNRDADDIERLSTITQGIDKKFEGNTSVLVAKVEKIVTAENLLKSIPASSKKMNLTHEKEKLLLHQQIRGQRDACFAQKDSKHHDKYLVLTVALAVLDGKATLKDLAQAKNDYPKYNESKFMHKTSSLIEKTILLCDPPAKRIQNRR